MDINDDYIAPYKKMGFDDKTSRTYGMITNLDENIGRLRQRLKELSIDDNTLVIFMSDNGPQHEDCYHAVLRDRKGSVYDGGIKVPFFVR